MRSLHPIIRGHRGHSYSFPEEALIHVACAQLTQARSSSKDGAFSSKRGIWLTWAVLGLRGQACLPATYSSLPHLLCSPSSQAHSLLPVLAVPYPSQFFIFSLLLPGGGLLAGDRRGVWVRHGQTFPIFYFTSHVFILMGIREKPHKQLAHQGFISWTLLLRVRQIGK